MRPGSRTPVDEQVSDAAETLQSAIKFIQRVKVDKKPLILLTPCPTLYNLLVPSQLHVASHLPFGLNCKCLTSAWCTWMVSVLSSTFNECERRIIRDIFAAGEGLFPVSFRSLLEWLWETNRLPGPSPRLGTWPFGWEACWSIITDRTALANLCRAALPVGVWLLTGVAGAVAAVLPCISVAILLSVDARIGPPVDGRSGEENTKLGRIVLGDSTSMVDSADLIGDPGGEYTGAIPCVLAPEFRWGNGGNRPSSAISFPVASGWVMSKQNSDFRHDWPAFFTIDQLRFVWFWHHINAFAKRGAMLFFAHPIPE